MPLPWPFIAALASGAGAIVAAAVSYHRTQRWVERLLPDEVELVLGPPPALKTSVHVPLELRRVGAVHDERRVVTGDPAFDALYAVRSPANGPPALAFLDQEMRKAFVRWSSFDGLKLEAGTLWVGPFQDREEGALAVSAIQDLAARLTAIDIWPSLARMVDEASNPTVRGRAAIALLKSGPDALAGEAAERLVDDRDVRVAALARLRTTGDTDLDALAERARAVPRVVAQGLAALSDDGAQERAAVAFLAIERSGDKTAWLQALHHGRHLPALAEARGALAVRLAKSPIPKLAANEEAIGQTFVDTLAQRDVAALVPLLERSEALFIPAVTTLEHVASVAVVPELFAVAGRLGGWRGGRVRRAAARIQERAPTVPGALSVLEDGGGDLAVVEGDAGALSEADGSE